MTDLNSLMLSEMGLGAANGIAGIFISSAERDIQRIQDKFQNTMAALSAAQSKNAITRNEVAIREQAKMVEAADQGAAIVAKEETRAAAAAAGVAGNSVNVSMQAVDRAKAQKAAALKREQVSALVGLGDQRRQVELDLAYSKVNTIMPSTLPSQMLGIAGNLLDIYKAYQPE